MLVAAEVFAAITSLRSALDITKAMVGLRDAEAFRSKSIELQGVILESLDKAIEAREAHAAQIDKVRALEIEIAELKTWAAEKRRYELKQLELGVLVYMLKPQYRGPEPPHWLCPNCYGAGKKSFFQPTTRTEAGKRIYECHLCHGKIPAETPRWLY
jgi:hypothetical protein